MHVKRSEKRLELELLENLFDWKIGHAYPWEKSCYALYQYAFCNAQINEKRAGGTLTLSAPASLSVCKFFLHYSHKISCLVMPRTKQLIIHSNDEKQNSPTFCKETIETV